MEDLTIKQKEYVDITVQITDDSILLIDDTEEHDSVLLDKVGASQLLAILRRFVTDANT